MPKSKDPGHLKHIAYERDDWRVRDKTNGYSRRGFKTEYDAWIWRQIERAARGLALIDDAKPEWFERSGDAIDFVRPVAPAVNPHIPADYAERTAKIGGFEYHFFVDRNGRAYKQDGDTLKPFDRPIAVEIENPSPPAITTGGYASPLPAGPMYGAHDTPEIMIPKSPPSIAIADHTIDIPEVLTITSRNQLVIADLHCPYHSGRALETALNAARRRFGDDFDTIIAGDLFDFAELSRHPKDEREDATELVFSTAGYVGRKIAEWVPRRVIILPGNHDRRFARKTGIPLQIDDLLAVAFKPQGIPTNVKWTNNDYLIIDNADPARRWLIGHPRNYSQQGGYTAARLAQIRQINVITAHDHTVGQQMSVDGRWRGISCGHMTRPDAHAYKRASLSIHREWSAGFVLLAEGAAECHTIDA